MPYLKVEEGGFVIAAESPTGEDLKEGDAFIASGKWYRRRKRCSFLSVITADEYQEAVGEGGDQEPAPASKEVDGEPDDEVEEGSSGDEAGDPELPAPADFKDLPIAKQKEIIKALDLQSDCDLRSSESMITAYADAYGQEG